MYVTACNTQRVLNMLYVKVFGVLQRFWPFRWLATVLALVTTVVVAPVAGLCNVVVTVGISSLNALHLLPSLPVPLQITSRQPV